MSHQKLVLLVDRCSWSREMLEAYLQDQGFRVISAAEGIEARALVEQRIPDLVLATADALELDRWRFLSWLKSAEGAPRIPVVTVCETETERSVCRAKGVDGCLCKPLRLKELIGAIRSRLAPGSGSLCALLLGA
jgi:twitching motility two-component system response regulator PilH